MSAPFIGITTSELRSPKEHANRPESEPPMREMALGLTYPRAVAREGGVPVVIPPFASDTQFTPLLDRLDGVCIAGGPDLHPSLYGQEPHPCLGPTEPEMDGCEVALIRLALSRRLPLLCICRGAQALNVACGGTLFQHIEGHRQEAPGRVPTHHVTLEPDSRLAGILGTTELDVNSFHHQAVDELGDGLRVAGRAPDGTVEAIEAVDRDFAIGVQWHAEGLVDSPEQRRLFDAFMLAASQPRSESPRRARRAA